MIIKVLSSRLNRIPILRCFVAFVLFAATCSPALAADRIQGRVEGGGGPLWLAF